MRPSRAPLRAYFHQQFGVGGGYAEVIVDDRNGLPDPFEEAPPSVSVPFVSEEQSY